MTETRKERRTRQKNRPINREYDEAPLDRQNDIREQWKKVRKIPILARVGIVLILAILAIVIGTMIGYSVLGDGSALDVFKKDTWQHIFDIYRGAE
ncbi:DNA-directed RNA polymerase subunit beta [Savagea faecisuis]|uniref:DNA-directed RNA polymerase subunit beta n=1 Tax=Savagea faecisuis TaxID=1274803 RepID=A0ABW3GZ86_9BACL